MDLKQGAIGGVLAQGTQDKLNTIGANSTTVTAVEGGNYTVPATDRTINILNIESTTDLNAVTITLPSGRDGQRIFVHSAKQIGTATFLMPGGAVDNGFVMLSPGDSVDFTYVKQNNWSRSV